MKTQGLEPQFSQNLAPVGARKATKTLYHFSLFASQRMKVWQAFERGCLSWI